MPNKQKIDPNRLKSRVPADRRGTIVHRSKRDILPRKARHKTQGSVIEEKILLD